MQMSRYRRAAPLDRCIEAAEFGPT